MRASIPRGAQSCSTHCPANPHCGHAVLQVGKRRLRVTTEQRCGNRTQNMSSAPTGSLSLPGSSSIPTLPGGWGGRPSLSGAPPSPGRPLQSLRSQSLHTPVPPPPPPPGTPPPPPPPRGVGASVSWHYKSLTKKCGPLNSRSVGDQIALSTFYFLSNIHSQRRDMFSLKPGKDFSID
jgi:hypothetical protein